MAYPVAAPVAALAANPPSPRPGMKLAPVCTAEPRTCFIVGSSTLVAAFMCPVVASPNLAISEPTKSVSPFAPKKSVTPFAAPPIVSPNDLGAVTGGTNAS